MQKYNEGMDIDHLRFVFSVKSCSLVSSLSGGNFNLYAADVKAAAGANGPSMIFKPIIFAEHDGIASIFGIEHVDGLPRPPFNKIRAEKQQAFIEFLRFENQKRARQGGIMHYCFTGHEYATEAGVTAAYILARNKKLMMGLGYQTDEGLYVNEAFDPEQEGWLEYARSILPWDKLGETANDSEW